MSCCSNLCTGFIVPCLACMSLVFEWTRQVHEGVPDVSMDITAVPSALWFVNFASQLITQYPAK